MGILKRIIVGWSNMGRDTLVFEQINQALVEFAMSGDDLICTYPPAIFRIYFFCNADDGILLGLVFKL